MARVHLIETAIQFVSDPGASTDRYKRLLGMEPTPYEGQYFNFDELAYLIFAPSSPGTGRRGTGVWFLVDDVDQSYRELGAEGFKFNEAPFDIPPGRLVTLFDPDGNLVGLIDNSKGGMPGLA